MAIGVLGASRSAGAGRARPVVAGAVVAGARRAGARGPAVVRSVAAGAGRPSSPRAGAAVTGAPESSWLRSSTPSRSAGDLPPRVRRPGGVPRSRPGWAAEIEIFRTAPAWPRALGRGRGALPRALAGAAAAAATVPPRGAAVGDLVHDRRARRSRRRPAPRRCPPWPASPRRRRPPRARRSARPARRLAAEPRRRRGDQRHRRDRGRRGAHAHARAVHELAHRGVRTARARARPPPASRPLDRRPQQRLALALGQRRQRRPASGARPRGARAPPRRRRAIRAASCSSS